MVDESELLHQAKLTPQWIHDFIIESNHIDPQCGSNAPGSLLYDGHKDALFYAIKMASEDCFAIPHVVHCLMLREHPLAGKLRRRVAKTGLSGGILKKGDVPYYMWKWNRWVQVFVEKSTKSKGNKLLEIWNLHCAFETIHPYELYNGKVGRILMVNHALLADIPPWIIPLEQREVYFNLITEHPSSRWVVEPLHELEYYGY